MEQEDFKQQIYNNAWKQGVFGIHLIKVVKCSWAEEALDIAIVVNKILWHAVRLVVRRRTPVDGKEWIYYKYCECKTLEVDNRIEDLEKLIQRDDSPLMQILNA